MKNILLYIAVILIWGSTWLAVMMQLGIVDPMVTSIYRFFCASLLIFGYCMVTGRSLRFSKGTHFWLMLQGICTFALNYWLFYQAQQILTSGLAAVLFSLLVFMNLFNAAVFLKTPVKTGVLIGALLGLAGIVFLFEPEIIRLEFSIKMFLMIGFGLMGTYIFSIGNMISARIQKQNLPVISTTAYSMLYGSLFLLVIALMSGKVFQIDVSLKYLGALSYAIVLGSVIAFLCYLYLIGQIGAGRTAYVTLVTPIIAMGLSTIFEGYQWNALALTGIVLIVVGNVIALRKG